MELPVLLISKGILLPGARLRMATVQSRVNRSMLDAFVLNASSPVQQILLAYQIEDAGDGKAAVHHTGTLAEVVHVSTWPYYGRIQYTIELLGVSRVEIKDFKVPMCIVEKLSSTGDVSDEVKAKFSKQIVLLAKNLESEREIGTLHDLLQSGDMDKLSDYVVSLIPNISYSTLLSYLSILNVNDRVAIAMDFLTELQASRSSPQRSTQRAIVPIPNQNKKKENMSSVEQLEEKLKKAGLPENVKEQVWADYKRLKDMGSSNSEYHVLCGYLNLVGDLPWSKSSSDVIDIKLAREYLDKSHDGMQNVKKRLLEYLAVRKISNNITGPILCFSGPPGIGKTSIAKAIAKSMGRNFERISLGGIRDESDIRGHRRTYVAAMTGRIIQAMKHAGTNNPVILLDEVDKLYAGNSGSPSAALLEVLDPEQNTAFVDHYLNLPFDLSNVIFLATANDESTIQGPLADRLEMIEMSGYSTLEKSNIAKNHIIPRQLTAHGLCFDHLLIHQEAITYMIERYTRESGVRQLERQIAAVCRHAALQMAEVLNTQTDADCLTDLHLPIEIRAEECRQMLGKEKYTRMDLLDKMKRFRPGTCFGMAWTPYGGELMVIGKGRIIMTGKLGDVLKESVDVARTWIRANAKRYEIDTLTDADLHVHLPAGAVGKDGPSAGCALVSALFSLASGRKVRSDTAVTGEISLTGQVLPVGGIKEKVLGAHRSGLRRVILPESNRRDTVDIDESITSEMSFVFVSEIEDLLENIMEKQVVDVLSKL